MDFIGSITLTLNSLLFFNLVPFAYLGFYISYWRYPQKSKQINFNGALVGILLLGFAALNFSKGAAQFDKNQRLLVLMHMLPGLLTLIMVGFFAQGVTLVKSGSGGGGWLKKKMAGKGGAPAQVDFTGFRLLNAEIEKLGWDDLIVSDELKEELATVVNLLSDPKMTKKYGIEAPKGILLTGPPGTGKTMIAKVVANIAGLSFFALRMDEVVSKWVGESEKNLSALFQAAQKHAPSVIFVDEVDAIGKSRSGESRWAENLLNHLLQLIDGVVKTEGLYVIAATNRDELVDAALKRAGRLNRVIEVPLPELEARKKLFMLYLAKLQLEDTVDLEHLAEITAGKSGADIREICNQAGLYAYARESGTKGKRKYLVSNDDLHRALTVFVSGKKKQL